MKKLWSLLCIMAVCNLPVSCCRDFDEEESWITAISCEVGTYSRPDFRNNSSTCYWSTAVQIAPSEFDYRVVDLSSPSSAPFGLINQAQACGPPGPSATQQITSIYIAAFDTLRFEDRTYLPGDNLNTAFMVVKSSQTYARYQTVEEFILAQQEDIYLFSSNRTPIVLQLVEEPCGSFSSPLLITMQFDDGIIASTRSDQFEIEGKIWYPPRPRSC